jgi:hypothetical protein
VGNYRLQQYNFNFGNTESNVLFMPESENFDVVILGSSHARSFSRKGNHERMEKITGKKIANLSKGHGAGGIKNQLLYLDYFLKEGNTAKSLVYFIDPFVFYNDKMDNNNFIYNNEPFDFSFATHIIQQGTRTETFVNYLKYKLKPYWWNYSPDTDTAETRYLTEVDSSKFDKRLAVMYSDGMKNEIREEKIDYLRKVIHTGMKNKMKIMFVVPPTLLGKLPDHDNMMQSIQKLVRDKGIPVHDYSTSVVEWQYYYDLDHLNTNGCNYFAEKYLKEILPD